MVVQLVLDVNGVLIKRKWNRSAKKKPDEDAVLPLHNKGFQHIKIRPFALDLLRAIDAIPGVTLIFWSSMTSEYMMPIVDLLSNESGVSNFSVMTQVDCTNLPHPEVTFKPLFAKDVARVYERYPDSDGVIFIDDSMQKMLYNEGETIRIVPEWNGEDYTDIELKTIIGELKELKELNAKKNSC